MNLRRLLPGLALALALSAGAAVAALHALGPQSNPHHGDFSLADAQEFDNFPLYFVGERFQGLPLTAIHRRNDAPTNEPIPGRRNFVSFKYGDCTPTGEAGCPAPLEIQIWPACDRNLSMYSLTPDIDGPGPIKARPLPHAPVVLRGVPGAFFEEGRSLELYTGAVTVVLFGFNSDQLLDAAAELRGVNTAASPGSQLAQPVSGALDGKLDCSRSSAP